MILIATAVYDTIQNDRTKYTKATCESLKKMINPDTTRVFFVDNGSCEETKEWLNQFCDGNIFNLITNDKNEGTAEAINKVIKLREKDDYIIKMDNDVVCHDYGWPDKMAECFTLDKKLGILGLKRKDLPNSPTSDSFTTELKFIKKTKGSKWIPIEVCDDIIGTCTMFNPKLLDKVGYLYQPTVYGFDDVLMCRRSIISGFYDAFLPHINIDHIDDGKNPFTEWKKRHARMYIKKASDIMEEYSSGKREVYYNPY